MYPNDLDPNGFKKDLLFSLGMAVVSFGLISGSLSTSPY